MNSSKITLNSCYTPGVYAATKAGLEAGSDALRVELASEEVSLLLICYKVSLCSRDRILSDPRSPAWPRLHNRAHSSCQQVFHVIHLCTLFILCWTWSDAIHSLFSLAIAFWISKAGTPLRGHEFKYGQPEGFGGFQEVLAHFLQLSPQTRAEDHWAIQYIQVSLASWPCINRLQIAFTKQTKSHPTIDKIQRSPTLHNLDQFWQDLWRSLDKRES